VRWQNDSPVRLAGALPGGSDTEFIRMAASIVREYAQRPTQIREDVP